MTGPAPDTAQRGDGAGFVEPGYWDVAGRWNDADADAVGAIASALDASSASGELPIVVWGSDPIEVALTAGGSVLGSGLVTLTYEDGTSHHFDVSGMSELLIAGPHPMGYHQLSMLVGRMSQPYELPLIVAPRRALGPAPGEKHWGVFAPLHSITHDDRRSPTFTDLDTVAELIAGLGGTIVATLPLLATFTGEHGEPDGASSPYTPVSRLYWNEQFVDRSGYPKSRADGFPAVLAYAAFRTPDPDLQIQRVHEQIAAQVQLAKLAVKFRARGQRLYLDLPVGAHPEGYDTYQHPSLFAPGVTVGAPPDAFFADGQNWGFPATQPLDPQSVWHFRDVVRAHMDIAGVLRIDHVMGLYRTYWVPDGFGATKGAYVRYPFEVLLAVACIESHRNDCWVVGEDLGTVPDEVRDAMRRRGILGMWVAEFEADSWWGGRPLAPPPDSVACVDTHDTPPFAAWLAERDGTLDPVVTHAAIVQALGASDAAIVLVSLDDLWGVTEPQNIPGTPATRPNWVHRFPVTLEAMAADPRVTNPLQDLHLARLGGRADA